MKRQVAAELKKFRTIWSTWLLLGITAFLVSRASRRSIAFAPHGPRPPRHCSFPTRGTVALVRRRLLEPHRSP